MAAVAEAELSLDVDSTAAVMVPSPMMLCSGSCGRWNVVSFQASPALTSMPPARRVPEEQEAAQT